MFRLWVLRLGSEKTGRLSASPNDEYDTAWTLFGAETRKLGGGGGEERGQGIIIYQETHSVVVSWGRLVVKGLRRVFSAPSRSSGVLIR